jgi:hypothetical protein
MMKGEKLPVIIKDDVSDEGSTVDQPPCQVTESERGKDAPTGQFLTTS